MTSAGVTVNVAEADDGAALVVDLAGFEANEVVSGPPVEMEEPGAVEREGVVEAPRADGEVEEAEDMTST